MSSEERPQEQQAWPLWHHQAPPDYQVSHEEDRTQQYTKLNKHQIEQTMKKLCDIDTTKVNTLIRPEGKKKAYVWLAPDCDALMLPTKLGSSK